jgi:hypothetical protein
MNAPTRPALAVLTTLLLAAPAAGHAEGVQVSGTNHGGASASVDIRIVVPAVMQVIENSHPTQLGVAVDGRWTAQQKLVVHSTMKRGFCVSLRLAAPQVAGWHLDAGQFGGASLMPVADGYRLCTSRPGRHTLVLQHAFASTPASDMPDLHWPVRTDVTAL